MTAAHTYGASLRAVSNWVRLDRRGGLRALLLKRRGRRVGGGLLRERRATRIRALMGLRSDYVTGRSYAPWAKFPSLGRPASASAAT